MASLQHAYTKELYHEFGYLATWLPGVKVILGDVGYLIGNQFKKITTLSQLGIPFSTDQLHHTITLDYASKNGISIQFKNKGELPLPNSTLLQAESGLSIQFLKENALIFKSNQANISTISNNLQLGKKIITQYKKELWKRKWVVITEIVTTDCTSIIMSNAANGRIEFKGAIAPGHSNVPLIDNQLALVHHSNISLRILSENQLTPLFKAMKIRGLNPFNPTFGEGKPRLLTFEKQAPEKLDFVYCQFQDE